MHDSYSLHYKCKLELSPTSLPMNRNPNLLLIYLKIFIIEIMRLYIFFMPSIQLSTISNFVDLEGIWWCGNEFCWHLCKISIHSCIQFLYLVQQLILLSLILYTNVVRYFFHKVSFHFSKAQVNIYRGGQLSKTMMNI